MAERNLSPLSTPVLTRFTDWILRGAVGFVFIAIGWEKITATPGSMWFTLFAHIGWGQWFRYFTGAVQMLGGGLMVLPLTRLLGMALLGSTMIGAILFHLFVLDDPFASVVPAALLVAIIAIGRKKARESDELTSLGL